MKARACEHEHLDRQDLLIVICLIAFCIVFWAPAILDLIPVMGDDFIYHHLPIKIFYARSLQAGTLPWWDPYTFCGALPVYLRFDGGPYYIPEYPFLLLAKPSQFQSAAGILIKAPLVLHFCWMIISCYLLGRLGFHFNRTGSIVFSLAYALSPAVTFLTFAASIVAMYSWLPSIWLCLLLYAQRGKKSYIALGSIAVALQLAAGAPGHLIRIWSFSSFMFCALAIIQATKKRWTYVRRLLAGGIFILAIALLLAAPVWMGLKEGYSNLHSSGTITFNKVAGGSNSLWPGYLITLLIPNIFGTWIGAHEWGLSTPRVLFDQSNLLGGLLIIFLIISGLITIKRKNTPERLWIILSFIGFVLSLFIVLGRHTPVFRWLYSFCPVFRSPYAIRWRDFECFTMAILAGASASVLTSSGFAGRLIPRWRIIVYWVFIILAIIAVCIYPVKYQGDVYFPGIKQAVENGSFPGLMREVLPYILFCSGIFLVMILSTRFRIKMLIGGIIIELVLWGWLALYLHRDWYGNDPLLKHYYSYRETPLGKVAGLQPEADQQGINMFRTAWYRSRLANAAWLSGNLSLLGYDTKPLPVRFRLLMDRISGGVGEAIINDWGSRLLPNMSVKWAVMEAEQLVEEGGGSLASIRKVETDGDKARLADHPVIVDVPGSLPRIHTQDTVVRCLEEEALKELINGDLRGAVFVEESNRLSVISEHQPGGQTDYRLPITDYTSFKQEPGYVTHFNELQSANPITELDFNNPNRVKVTIDVTIPSMLVMTDAWHPDWMAEVDGRTVPLLRVNYLQRGIWLSPGRHEIRLDFLPRSWRVGRWGTLSGLIAVGVLLIFGRRKRE